MGVIWGDAYLTMYIINPEAFEAPGVDSDYASVHFLYYSYATLTTLGYGDISPVSPSAQTIAWLEAVVGQLFIGVTIARLVGLLTMQKD